MARAAKHPEWPYVCNRFCKIHYYWDFETESHQPLPQSWNIKREAGWVNQVVFVGPPGYKPRKPNDTEWNQVLMSCPHEQIHLDCNMCLRHMFRPLEL